jgi:hypothetical protein
MSLLREFTHRGFTVTRKAAGVGSHVVWTVIAGSGRKRKELVRDIAPDADAAHDRAIAFIDQLQEKSQ